VARAHCRPVGEPLDWQPFAEPLARPGEQRRKPALRAIRLEQRRELRLAAGAPVVDHEILRRALCHRLAKIIADEGEREVDPSADPGRGPHRSVADEDAVRLDPNLRIGAGELGSARPVRGCATAVEQPGGGQDKGAGAHAGDPARAAGRGADKG